MPARTRRRRAGIVSERLDLLTELSSDQRRVTRLYLSDEHKAAARLVSGWMTAAGMTAWIDPGGTVVGRYEAAQEGARAVVVGGRIDTARDAGRRSGAVGVILAIQAVGALSRRRQRLAHAIEIMAFGVDEDQRFGGALPVPRVSTSTFDAAALDAQDPSGLTLREALRRFGAESDEPRGPALRSFSPLAFVEVLPEVGSILDAEELPVGVATAISGATRLAITVTGKAGHASSVALAQRRDALAATAEMVLAAETQCRQSAGLLATVSRLEVEPGLPGRVPALARMTLELASPVDRVRRTGARQLERSLRDIARRRRCGIEIATEQDEAAIACDARLIAGLSAAVESCGATPYGMPSGAGVLTKSFAGSCPVGMLLLRCKGGISRQHDDTVTLEDIELGGKVLLDFLTKLDMIGGR